MNKLLDLAAAVAMVNDGDTVAFGGNVLYRSPIAAVKELIRQDKKDLHLVKTAIAYEVDLLCAFFFQHGDGCRCRTAGCQHRVGYKYFTACDV